MDGTSVYDREKEEARKVAETQLAALGFTRNGSPRWRREEFLDWGELILEVQLQDVFPSEVPEVFVQQDRLPRHIPHVEMSGKICQPSGDRVLLDTRNPAGLVAEAVDRARDIVLKGVSGQLDSDLHREFLAYWNREALSELHLWFLDPPGSAREVYACNVPGVGRRIRPRVISDDIKRMRRWAKRIGREVKSLTRAFFIPLASAFDPPGFKEPWSLEQFYDVLKSHAHPGDVDSFIEWLEKAALSPDVYFSMPAPTGEGVVLAGARFSAPENSRGKKSNNAAEDISARVKDPIVRIQVDRIDNGFLLPRTGGALGLSTKTIVLVGCGAVGSQVARFLAQLGLGQLKTIDGEVLGVENIHRHQLGFRRLGQSKAEALAEELTWNYPNLEAKAYFDHLDQVYAKNPSVLREADAIVFATGNENLERRYNKLLIGGPPRIHTWLEPMGIGGHAVAAGVSPDSGCFECLYRPMEGAPLFNRASFASQGQAFEKSMAGCAGTFIPFSAMDAVRTGEVTARLTAAVLTGQQTSGVLISWFGDPDTFQAEGFKLSERANRFKPGELRRHDLERLDCESCVAR